MGKVVAKPEGGRDAPPQVARHGNAIYSLPYIHCPYPSMPPLRLLIPATSSTVRAVSPLTMMLPSHRGRQTLL
jgi:hypothetical protein